MHVNLIQFKQIWKKDFSPKGHEKLIKTTAEHGSTSYSIIECTMASKQNNYLSIPNMVKLGAEGGMLSF